ncbi:MAG: Maf family protein [Clostridiales bacterium]|nr:Maf family protein [Clostridiales bacterium]
MAKLILASASPRRAALMKQIGLEFDVCATDADETADGSQTAEQYVMRTAMKKARAAQRALFPAGGASDENAPLAGAGGANALLAGVAGANALIADAADANMPFAGATGANALFAGAVGANALAPRTGNANAPLAGTSGANAPLTGTSGTSGANAPPAVLGPFDCIIIGADTAVVSPSGEILGKPTDRGDARRMLRALSGAWHEVYTGLALVGMAGDPQGAGSRQAALADFAMTKVKIADLSEALIERYLDTGEPFGKAGSYAIQGMGALLAERIDGCYFNVVGLPLNRLAAMLASMGCDPRN